MTDRLSWIDRWRGFLILQIVAFHVLGAFIQSGLDSADALLTVHRWIERYCVLAFFSLTGVVWNRKSSFREFLIGKVRRLLIPYFVFGGFWAACFAALASRFHCAYVEEFSMVWWQPFASVLLCNGYPNGIGARVVNALWFLPSLFGVSLAYFAIDRVLPLRSAQLLLLLPLFAMREMLGGVDGPWGVDRIPYFLMFVIIARWAIPRTPFSWVYAHRLGGVGLAIFFYAIAGASLLIRWCFGAMGVGAWSWVFVTMAMIAASAIFAQAVQIRFLERVGRDSLGVLVLHKFPILAFQAIPGMVAWVMGLVVGVRGAFALALVALAVSVSCAVTEILRRCAPFLLGERKVGS